jgi:hypothetical protein
MWFHFSTGSKQEHQMNSTLKRLAAVAAVSATCILAPVAGASAATLPFGFVGPTVWPGAFAVIGPTVYTVGAGNIFTATTITTTGAGAAVGAGPA